MNKFLRKFNTIRFIATWSIFRNFLRIFHFLNLNLNFKFWPVGYRPKPEPVPIGLGNPVHNTLSARALPLQSPSTTSPSSTLPATPTLLAEAARLPATELHCIEIFLRHAIYRRSDHTVCFIIASRRLHLCQPSSWPTRLDYFVRVVHTSLLVA